MLTDEQKANRAARLERIEAQAAVAMAAIDDVGRLLRIRDWQRSSLIVGREQLEEIEDDLLVDTVEIAAIQRRLRELGYTGN